MVKKHFPDQMIQAYVDGEIPKGLRLAVLEKAADSHSSMVQLSKLLHQKSLIKQWWLEQQKET